MVVFDRLFLHKTNDVYTLPVCVLQWKHESLKLKYYFSVDMAEVDLSDAEKIFIIHGVQVMFILLFFKPDLTNFSLNRLDLCSNPTRLRGYFFSQFLCVTYAYVYSISSIGIYGKHFRVCYSVNYVNKINEVNVFDIEHSF